MSYIRNQRIIDLLFSFDPEEQVENQIRYNWTRQFIQAKRMSDCLQKMCESAIDGTVFNVHELEERLQKIHELQKEERMLRKKTIPKLETIQEDFLTLMELFPPKTPWPHLALPDFDLDREVFYDLHLAFDFNKEEVQQGCQVLPGTHANYANDNSDDYFHPHIDTDGRICWGAENLGTASLLWEKKDIIGLTYFLIDILSNYNSSSPYLEIEKWHSGEDEIHCAGCGEVCDPEEMNYIDGEPGCLHCSVYIDRTELTYWRENCRDCYRFNQTIPEEDAVLCEIDDEYYWENDCTWSDLECTWIYDDDIVRVFPGDQIAHKDNVTWSDYLGKYLYDNDIIDFIVLTDKKLTVVAFSEEEASFCTECKDAYHEDLLIDELCPYCLNNLAKEKIDDINYPHTRAA